MSLVTSHANGNEIYMVGSRVGSDDEAQARRFAAALDRNDPAVDSVDPGVGDTVDVWLTTDSRIERFRAPAGWRINHVSTLGDTGGVCVTCERVDA